MFYQFIEFGSCLTNTPTDAEENNDIINLFNEKRNLNILYTIVVS